MEGVVNIKKAKILLSSIIGLFLVAVLILFILLIGIRGEFKEYLSKKYPNQSFDIGFTKIDPIYGNFYANVTCLNDYTPFPISKSFETKDIREDYTQYKSGIQYNSKIKGIFEGSDIKNYIRSVTGGGKIPFENGGVYTQIDIMLTNDAEPISVAKKALNVLKDNNISAERIGFMYEKDKHVYEIRLSSADYALSETELEAKVKEIK